MLYFLILFGTLAQLAQNNLACKLILEDDVSFIVSEVSEAFPQGAQLPESLPLDVEPGETIHIQNMHKKGDSWAWIYTSATVNRENSSIDFYLLKPLSEYRTARWEPSLESEFSIECSRSGEINFTHLLLIQDENLYDPKFDAETYNGLLTHSPLHGFHLHFNNTNNENNIMSGDGVGIHVKDIDFNPKNANVTISCSGTDCKYFSFHPRNMGFDQGYNFNILPVLNEKLLFDNVKDGQLLNHLELIANDGVRTSKANVSIYVSRTEKPPPTSEGPFPVLPVAVGGGLTLLVLLACSSALAYFMVRSRKSKNIVRKLTQAEISEFLNGTANISGEIRNRSVDVNTPIMAMPYNRNFEIPRDKLRIDETSILGTGAFGVVWKGSVVFTNGEGITVAVKSIKRNVGVLYFKALLSELKIMAYIGKHPNIVTEKISRCISKFSAFIKIPKSVMMFLLLNVSLVGACTHNIRKREVYIAVQYCANGNFHDYLKCRRDRFENLITEDGSLQLTNAAAYTYVYSNKGCFSKSLSTMDLLRWATQVANGLQYLESLGVIHGDLALRNILLDNHKMAKIADFGLSRRLLDYSSSSSDYYKKTTPTPLPWKWLSPESLRHMRFSLKSDIWSFGIVLWEIFTLAQTPYQGLNWDEEFLEKLEGGMIPKKPAFATFQLYEIMKDCWTLEPHDRPVILDIKRTLEEITNTALRQDHDLSYLRFLGDQPFITMLNEDQEGYLLPNDENRVDYIDT